MTRQELLTRLATECATWDEAISQALSNEWFLHYTQGWTELRNNIFATGVKGIFVTDWLAERERLLNKPSWKDAPDDATHLAIDSDKEWFFYSEEPTRTAQMWWPEKIAGSFAGMAIAIPAGYDWRESLEARPV